MGAHSFLLLTPFWHRFPLKLLLSRGSAAPHPMETCRGEGTSGDAGTATSVGQIQHQLPEEDPGPMRGPAFKGSLQAMLVSSGRRNGPAPQGVLSPCQMLASSSPAVAPQPAPAGIGVPPG